MPWDTRTGAGTSPRTASAFEDFVLDYVDALNWINVKAYGATGDGTTNDYTAVAAAIAACSAAGGGVVWFPTGTYMIGTALSIPTYVRLCGSGKNSAIIKKSGNITLLNFSGSSNSTRCQRGGAMDLKLDGGGFTGPVINAKWADHMNFDRLWLYNNGAVGVKFENVWDSYFNYVEFDTVSGIDGFNPSVLLTSNSDDSTNVIGFHRCRWENFKDGALWCSTAPIVSAYTMVTGSNPVYDVRLTDCKIETPQLRGLMFTASADVGDVHMDGMYVAARGLYSGISTGRTLFSVIGASDMTFRRFRVRIDGVTNPTVDDVFTVNTSGHGFKFEDIFVDATQLPNTGIFSWDGGTPEAFVSNVRYKTGQAGVIYAGSAGNITQPTVASHATAMPVVRGPKVINVSGTATITTIPVVPGGREPVTLNFTSTAGMTDGSNLLLNGNFAGPGQITLWADDTNWYEIARDAPTNEISYVELASDVTVNATTAAGANTLVTAAAFTANGTDAYWVEFECAMAQPAQTAGASIIFVIYDGASVIANSQLAVVAAYSATGVGGAPVSRKRRLTPSAASHTYSVRAYRTGADGTVRAASGTYMPAHIRITKA